MADLASHFLINHIAGVRWVDRCRLGFLVSGALMPDLASRVPRVLLNGAVERGWIESSQGTFRAMLGLDFPHTPLGAALVAVVIALLLPQRLAYPPGRASVAKMLCLGAWIHLGVDLLQHHLMPGYRYLYPFSVEAFELGLISTEESLAAIPVLALVAWWIGRGRDGDSTARH
jgi:hypothetical protein